MKFKILLSLLIVASFSSSAIAGSITSAGTSIGSANTPYKPSSKVGITVLSSANTFAVTGQHASATGNAGAKGGWQYGTTDSDPSLKRAPASTTALSAGAAVPTAPASNATLTTDFVNY